MRVGLVGYAVDPRQRDALVARVRVVLSDGVRAVARITSQVSLVKADHVMLIIEPEPAWWRRGSFWWGLSSGAVLGAGTAVLARP